VLVLQELPQREQQLPVLVLVLVLQDLPPGQLGPVGPEQEQARLQVQLLLLEQQVLQ
jgi:hypothetical protein